MQALIDLDHSGMLHNVYERCDIERLEQATDNLSNSLETFVEGWQVCFQQLIGVPRHIHSVHSCTVFIAYNQNGNITFEIHMIRCSPIAATKVRYQYGLFNT